MSMKITSLNPLDKGFFGKTMREWANCRMNIANEKPSKLQMTSVDDFNKHFQDKLFSKEMRRVLNSDVFSKQEEVLPDQFPMKFF